VFLAIVNLSKFIISRNKVWFHNAKHVAAQDTIWQDCRLKYTSTSIKDQEMNFYLLLFESGWTYSFQELSWICYFKFMCMVLSIISFNKSDFIKGEK